jgi:hypothetical protein
MEYPVIHTWIEIKIDHHYDGHSSLTIVRISSIKNYQVKELRLIVKEYKRISFLTKY